MTLRVGELDSLSVAFVVSFVLALCCMGITWAVC